jgi:hypothetical protein
MKLNSVRILLSVARSSPKCWLALLQDGKALSEKGHTLRLTDEWVNPIRLQSVYLSRDEEMGSDMQS